MRDRSASAKVAGRSAFVRAWLPAVLYMALTFVLSSLQIQPPGVEQFPLHDKGMHMVEYAGLGFLLGHAVRRSWPTRALWRIAAVAILMGAAWGVLDEIHQAFVPSRQSDILDAAADLAGVSFGVAVRMATARIAAFRASRASRASRGA